jgi:esterase
LQSPFRALAQQRQAEYNGLAMQLEHTIVGAGSARWGMLFLHGMLGRGTNWQSFAKRLVDERPDWAAVLVDLRMHGASQGFEPPHTLATAAADLTQLVNALPWPVSGVLGHSFGGKVALSWLGTSGDVAALSAVRQAWIVDAPPGSRTPDDDGDSVPRVLAVLRRLDRPWESRQAFVVALGEAGISRPTAAWLAQNLERVDGQLVLRLDLDAIEALLSDHYSADLWPVIDRLSPNVELHLVVGGRSKVFIESERQRARRYASAGKLTLHVLERAGHWVHAEDPEGLLRCMLMSL